MILSFNAPGERDRDDVAALTTEIRVRVLNVSGQGCLVETNRPLEIGAAATLRLVFATGDFEDTVQIVRCQEISGAGATYHVGLVFLATAPASIESLRYLIRRESGRWAGWIRMDPKG